MDRLPDLPLLLVFARVAPCRQRAAVARTCRRWAACARWVHAPSAYVRAVHAQVRDAQTAHELWAHARHLIVPPASENLLSRMLCDATADADGCSVQSRVRNETNLCDAAPSTNDWHCFFDNLCRTTCSLFGHYHNMLVLPVAHVRAMVDDYGVDPSRNCNAALRQACAAGNAALVRYLLSDARVDPCAVAVDDEWKVWGGTRSRFPFWLRLFRVIPSLLVNAMSAGHVDVARALLEDARIDVQIPTFHTVIVQVIVDNVARDNRMVDLLPLLWEHGVDADTTLCEAAHVGNVRALNVVLGHASTTFASQTLTTALVFALLPTKMYRKAPCEAEATVRRLLQCGARPWDVSYAVEWMWDVSYALKWMWSHRQCCRHFLCVAVRINCRWAVRAMLTQCEQWPAQAAASVMRCARRWAKSNVDMQRLLDDPRLLNDPQPHDHVYASVATPPQRCASRARRRDDAPFHTPSASRRGDRHKGKGATMRSGRFKCGRR